MSERFATIVADPPWDYEGFATMPGNPRRKGHKVRRVELPYDAMSLAQIAALPVVDSAAADCRLFLWTTNRYLPDVFGVLAAWGFTYKQTIVWRKTGNPSPFGGSVAPNHAEYLLVATIGSPPVTERLKTSVIDAPAAAPGRAPGGSRSHSAKPDLFLDLIEQCSPGPYLELFARRARLGDWSYWGDQSLGTAELAATLNSSGGEQR